MDQNQVFYKTEQGRSTFKKAKGLWLDISTFALQKDMITEKSLI